MIKLTKLADYAVILMCEMSHADGRVSAQDLAGSTSIPVPTVSKILNMLSRGGLLQSHRGLKGGFSLTRSPNDISVTEIVEIMDGPIALTLCTENAGGSCDCGFDDVCSLRPRWNVINEAVRGALNDVKLSSLAKPVIGGHVMQLEKRAEASK